MLWLVVQLVVVAVVRGSDLARRRTVVATAAAGPAGMDVYS